MWGVLWYRLRGLLFSPYTTLNELFVEKRYMWSCLLGFTGIWLSLPRKAWFFPSPWLLVAIKAVLVIFFLVTGILTLNFKVMQKTVHWKDFNSLWGFSYLPLIIFRILYDYIYPLIIRVLMGNLGPLTSTSDYIFMWVYLVLILFLIIVAWYIILSLQIMRIASGSTGWRYWAGVFTGFVLIFVFNTGLKILARGGVQ